MITALKESSTVLNSNILHQAPSAVQEPWRFTPLAKINDLFLVENETCANLDRIWKVPADFADVLTLSEVKVEPISPALDQSNQVVRDACATTTLLQFKANSESKLPLVIDRK